MQDGVPICDVDQTAGGSDTVPSRDAEPKNLGQNGWGVYYGAAFRAPAHEYKGSVPITRIYNQSATYHDWTTPLQKSQKEAKYKGKTTNEGVAFYAWRTQVEGTVPVYRLTRGGSHTQTIFSTDKAWVDRLLAQSGSNPNGWKRDQFAPFIAFYAYPPNYQVADTPNPYDCSIKENYVTSRCDTQRANLEKAATEGRIPEDNQCPQTLTDFQEAPFPGEFTQDCQNYWNTYAKDCSITENYASDRCIEERQKVAAAQQEAIRKREEAQRAALAAKQASQGGSSGSGTSSGNSSGTSRSGSISGGVNNVGKNIPSSGGSSTSGTYTPGGSGDRNRGNVNAVGNCTIRWKQTKLWGQFGASTGSKKYSNLTQTECIQKWQYYKRNPRIANDFLARSRYDITFTWNPY